MATTGACQLLFCITRAALDEGKLRIGQALADVATIGLLQQRAIHRDVQLVRLVWAAVWRWW
jgi:hypothetical protein